MVEEEAGAVEDDISTAATVATIILLLVTFHPWVEEVQGVEAAAEGVSVVPTLVDEQDRIASILSPRLLLWMTDFPNDDEVMRTLIAATTTAKVMMISIDGLRLDLRVLSAIIEAWMIEIETVPRLKVPFVPWILHLVQEVLAVHLR